MSKNKNLQKLRQAQAAQQQEGQQTKKNALTRFRERNNARRAQQPAQGKSILREAVKDVRSTIHEVFFGKGEGANEPGTPYNPTPQIVTADLKKTKQVQIER